ncbi:MAG: hypothetical protein LBG83_03950 [Oscillospiraceae bacterium]|jgi:RNA-binding protein YlmH|nr:hypothetical protein [Oscillospiraceae bacterium]
MINDILPHLRDLAHRGGAGSFLTPEQAALARRAFGGELTLLGGFDEAERQAPVFAGGPVAPEDYIAAVKLSFRPQDRPGHRDILGAALGLGIDRAVLGDIVVEDSAAYLVCLRRVQGFLCENLDMAGRVRLRAEPIALSELPAARNAVGEHRGTVASLRLDNLLAEAFTLSRSQAEELLRLGLVQLCHEECRKGSKLVRQGDIISVRGKGRARLLEIGPESKKGRVWVTLGMG